MPRVTIISCVATLYFPDESYQDEGKTDISSDVEAPGEDEVVKKRSIVFNSKVELITEEHDEDDGDKLVVKRVSSFIPLPHYLSYLLL